MKNILVVTLLGLLNISIATAGEDTVLDHGKNLHDSNCMACHETKVYTRQNRSIKSLPGLEKQVQGCMKGAAKVEWTTSESNSVTRYLNTEFYKFESEQ